MPTVNIVCGDFHPGPSAFDGHYLTLQPLDLDKPLLRVACSHLRDVECVGCEESLSLASALVWGGPVCWSWARWARCWGWHYVEGGPKSRSRRACVMGGPS